MHIKPYACNNALQIFDYLLHSNVATVQFDDVELFPGFVLPMSVSDASDDYSFGTNQFETSILPDASMIEAIEILHIDGTISHIKNLPIWNMHLKLWDVIDTVDLYIVNGAVGNRFDNWLCTDIRDVKQLQNAYDKTVHVLEEREDGWYAVNNLAMIEQLITQVHTFRKEKHVIAQKYASHLQQIIDQMLNNEHCDVPYFTFTEFIKQQHENNEK